LLLETVKFRTVLQAPVKFTCSKLSITHTLKCVWSGS